MNLGKLIAVLETQDPDRFVENGFARPHSYRGYYEMLAFEPEANVRVGDMLAWAKGAVDASFSGYKGGTYRMNLQTPVWLAKHGETGQEITQPLLSLVLAPAEAGASLGAVKVRIETFTASADPPIPLWTVVLATEQTEWRETFGSLEQTHAFLHGVQASAMVLGHRLRLPEVPREGVAEEVTD